MQPQPTIVELNMDDIQVEMDRTAPQVSGSSVRSQQRTTNHFCPRAMDNLWTHLSDLERLLDSEQVPARREPEGTGGAGGENVNSNTMPAEGVPAVEVDEAESNSSVEFTAPVPLHHSQRSLNLSNTDLGPENGSTSQTNSANNTRDRTRTVMVSEFHEFMSRFTRAQPRINRMMERATEFFARDPSFQSTTGEDYIEQERFMQDFQQVNRLAGMIHRGVSIAQVPLSQIPPRALMAQTRQDSVPNVSGLPLGGLASAGRNSRRNETPTAGGRGRIHVRSSTPSSRSASTNFSLPSNITIVGSRHFVIPSRVQSSSQQRRRSRETATTSASQRSTAGGNTTTTTTTQASGRRSRGAVLNRILRDIADLNRDTAGQQNPRPSSRSRDDFDEIDRLLDSAPIRVFRRGRTPNQDGSRPAAPANSAEQLAASGNEADNESSESATSSARRSHSKRSASKDDHGGKAKKAKK